MLLQPLLLAQSNLDLYGKTSRQHHLGRSIVCDVQVNPLTGRGPAWANSLFEDNAQFGLGISMGLKQRRASYAAAVKSLLADKEGPGSQELRNAFEEWLQVGVQVV